MMTFIDLASGIAKQKPKLLFEMFQMDFDWGQITSFHLHRKQFLKLKNLTVRNGTISEHLIYEENEKALFEGSLYAFLNSLFFRHLKGLVKTDQIFIKN